jgi:hypothetical protein
MTRCECATPDLAPTTEGVWVCNGCGERVGDRRDELRDRALLALVARVRVLEAQVAELRSNGDVSANADNGRNGHNGNGRPAPQPALFDTETPA